MPLQQSMGTMGYILLNHKALSQNTKLYIHKQWMRKFGLSTSRTLFHRDCYIQMVMTFPSLTSVFPDYIYLIWYLFNGILFIPPNILVVRQLILFHQWEWSELKLKALKGKKMKKSKVKQFTPGSVNISEYLTRQSQGGWIQDIIVVEYSVQWYSLLRY